MPERASDGTAPSQPETPRASGLAEHYAALEQTLNATPRGRWFLEDYLRRHRSGETQMLLDAITRLETAVLKPHHRQPAPSGVFAELVEMSEALARTRREIAQIKPPHQFDRQLISAAAELDHIVEATEKATSDILQAAEEIQEVAWTLREGGTEIEFCDKIDQRATDIYTACSFQDITGQRTEKVVRALRFIEQRINAMIEIWGVDDIAFKVDEIASRMQAFAQAAERVDAHLTSGPQSPREGLKQDDVDRMLRRGHAPTPPAQSASTRDQGASESQGPSGGQGGSGGFERPEPLTLARLHAVKRAALFG